MAVRCIYAVSLRAVPPLFALTPTQMDVAASVVRSPTTGILGVDHGDWARHGNHIRVARGNDCDDKIYCCIGVNDQIVCSTYIDFLRKSRTAAII